MKDFQMFLDNIDEPEKRKKMKTILDYIKENFPKLREEIKWNQPMFTNEGTFIIGFSVSKGHIAVSPEPAAISKFMEEIEEIGYSHTSGLYRIKWKDEIDFELINKIISYNIEDKKGMTKFWR